MTGGTDGRLRVGVIGCGYIGATGHLPAFAGAAGAGLCTLAGVADPDTALAERVAQPYGVPAFGSATALLDGARPDVVSIATMPSTHRDLVLEALAAGCHVLCEKPVATERRRGRRDGGRGRAGRPAALHLLPVPHLGRGAPRPAAGRRRRPGPRLRRAHLGRRGAQLPHQPGQVPPRQRRRGRAQPLDGAQPRPGPVAPGGARAPDGQRLLHPAPGAPLARRGAAPGRRRAAGLDTGGGRSGDRGPGRGLDPAGRGRRPDRRGGLAAAPLGPQRGVGAAGRPWGGARSRPPGCGSTAASGWTRRPRQGRWPPAITTWAA